MQPPEQAQLESLVPALADVIPLVLGRVGRLLKQGERQAAER